MEIYTPSVKDISLYKEMANNIVNPLEVLREAISNSHDAESKQISIIVSRDSEGIFTIEVQDDGKGMDINDIQRFFNMGDSKKGVKGIGSKGLGTKTYFRSSKIEVFTQTKNGDSYKVIMDKPWDQLNANVLPQYSVEKIPPQLGRFGTNVIIKGYAIDNPERYFNYYIIKDYILWFTACGSFKTHFANIPELHKHILNMQIAPRIFIEDKILELKDEIAGSHQFAPPMENPHIDSKEDIYIKSVNYCRYLGPYHRGTNINGEYVSVEIFGTISGLNCRKTVCRLLQGETIKSRFGSYICKDFIPFMKRLDLLNDPNYQHYHLLINSQAFELIADRNNLSNEDDPKVKWALEEARKIINDEIRPIAEACYFRLRKIEEAEHALAMKQIHLNLRMDEFDQIEDLPQNQIPILKKPTCEAQTIILFAALLSNQITKDYIKHIDKIGNYSQSSVTDMICIDKENNRALVEFEYKLSSLFRHDHPYSTFDYLVCWDVDIPINERKNLSDGTCLLLIEEQDELFLKFGTQKIIPIIELKTIISKVKNDKAKVNTIEKSS